MTYPSRGVPRHALCLLLFFWFFCHVILTFLPINMPVTTRSQARTSTRSILEPLKSSTFPMSFEQSLGSDLPNNAPVLLSTSLIAEPLTTTGHHLSSSTNLNTKHSEILQLGTTIICPIPNSGKHQSSSLEQLNLESASTFEISNLSNFENLKSPLGNQLPSHNSSISNLSIMDDDDDADYLSQASARYAKTSTDIMDMNNLFAAIKDHLTEATTKLSSDFRQVVKTNDDFKKEVRQEMDEMRQFLHEQKRLLKIDQFQDPPITTSMDTSSSTWQLWHNYLYLLGWSYMIRLRMMLWKPLEIQT